jgi:hypothetical protein
LSVGNLPGFCPTVFWSTDFPHPVVLESLDSVCVRGDHSHSSLVFDLSEERKPFPLPLHYLTRSVVLQSVVLGRAFEGKAQILPLVLPDQNSKAFSFVASFQLFLLSKKKIIFEVLGRRRNFRCFVLDRGQWETFYNLPVPRFPRLISLRSSRQSRPPCLVNGEENSPFFCSSRAVCNIKGSDLYHSNCEPRTELYHCAFM